MPELSCGQVRQGHAEEKERDGKSGMNDIYVITGGEYSDYGIYGVTTDYGRAIEMQQIVQAHLGSYEDARIETYKDGIFDNERMNTIVPKEFWKVFLESGKVPFGIKYVSDRKFQMQVIGGPKKGPWELTRNGIPRREIKKSYVVHNITADDEEQAIKIAIDAVAKHEAEKEGIT